MTLKNDSQLLRARRIQTLKEHRSWLKRAEKLARRPAKNGGSPHPSIKVGAILVDANGEMIAASSNRFPRGVANLPERTKEGSKSLWFNCAEQLALMQALRRGKRVRGARMYVTLEPCATCAGMMAEAKLAAVYFPSGYKKRNASLKPKWDESIEIGRAKLREVGVAVVAVKA